MPRSRCRDRSWPTPAVIAAAVLAALLVLAGCGGDSDQSDAGLGPADPAAAEDASADGVEGPADPEGPDGPVVSAADTSAGDSNDGTAQDGEGGEVGAVDPAPTAADIVASPLGQFLGDDTYGAEWSPAAEERRRQAEAERQTFIVSCMAEAGFDYLPIDPATVTGAGPGVGAVAAEQTRAWAERYGFGVSTTRFSQAEVGDDLVGHDRPGPVVGGHDPNLAITSTLSPQELERYFAALYGDGGGPGGFEVGGCLGGAAASSAAASIAFYDEFGPDLDALYAEIEADERLTAAEDEVRSCVAAAGVDYVAPAERFRHFDVAVSGVVEGATHPSDSLSERELALLSAAEVDELMRRPRQLSATGREQLRAVQAAEVALALAVFDCGGGGLAQAVLRSEVTAAYEERFIAEHTDRLEPFRAS